MRYCRVGLPIQPSAPPVPDQEEAMEQLLVDLSTQVEGPLAAAPLSLLAWHSWARGGGALARIAVDRALAENPTYRLAGLLSAVLDHGIAPEWVGVARRADEAAS
jgi:hypothetical protein